MKGRLTEVCHGVHARASSLPPQDLDGRDRDHQEDGEGHAQPDQQREVSLQHFLS